MRPPVRVPDVDRRKDELAELSSVQALGSLLTVQNFPCFATAQDVVTAKENMRLAGKARSLVVHHRP